jgi:hypothetical protein
VSARKRLARRVVVGCVASLGVLNLVAWQHARAFTRFGPPGERTRPPQLLSLGEKVRVLARGASVPRPENRRTPLDVGLSYERQEFAGVRGIPLEAWFVPGGPNRVDRGRGLVVLFHGHATSKDVLLREAAAFHALGFASLLVDFHGSGGSGGNETSIGFHEAGDVAAAFLRARELSGGRPVVLYGVSMGAAAILKAVAEHPIDPVALVLECPFDSLIGTVRHRFAGMGLPAWGGPELLVFWGGVQQGFDGFALRPVDYAARVARPTLLMAGVEDPFVKPVETTRIFDGLRGDKTLRMFDGVGHQSLLRAQPAAWREAVGAFLERVAPAE